MLQDQKADAQLVGTDLESDTFFAKKTNKQTNKVLFLSKRKKKHFFNKNFHFKML